MTRDSRLVISDVQAGYRDPFGNKHTNSKRVLYVNSVNSMLFEGNKPTLTAVPRGILDGIIWSKNSNSDRRMNNFVGFALKTLKESISFKVFLAERASVAMTPFDTLFGNLLRFS